MKLKEGTPVTSKMPKSDSKLHSMVGGNSVGVGSVGWGSASSGWKVSIFFAWKHPQVKMYNLGLAEAKVAQEQEVVNCNVSRSRISSHRRDNQLQVLSVLTNFSQKSP